ncbi:hypothetical protein [Rhodococcus sp. I2R]|uniref:hypothetical protein n=1 Tax=Rhodococcus sp. I2R TaxID=2855445 RepID=UPI001E334447|nr:hypothetical protein [Rhodococcus sp. I2R]MCC8930584.1 hypothetical protein [Rhodococcus sp. I2R]
MDVTVSVLADRPDLADALWSMPDSWPRFMTRDPIATMYYTPDVLELFGAYVLVCQDETGNVVGKAFSIPFHLAEGDALPIDGWDGAIQRGISTRLTGRTPNTVSALEIAVAPERSTNGETGQDCRSTDPDRSKFREPSHRCIAIWHTEPPHTPSPTCGFGTLLRAPEAQSFNGRINSSSVRTTRIVSGEYAQSGRSRDCAVRFAAFVVSDALDLRPSMVPAAIRIGRQEAHGKDL